MHKRITFRGMDSSAAIEKYVDQQLDKVVKFLSNEKSPVSIDIVLDNNKVHAHNRVEVRIKSPNYDLVSHYEDPKMYDAIDKAIDRIYTELRRHKEKLIDKRKTGDKNNFDL